MRSMDISTDNTRTPISLASRLLRIALWTLQILLAALFMWHGLFMLFPPAGMAEMINASMGLGLRFFIGAAEVLAALGLVLPGLTRVLPRLTVWAAAGLMPIMAGAIVFHLMRGEGSSAVSAAIIFVLVSLVAFARWKLLPIPARKRQI